MGKQKMEKLEISQETGQICHKLVKKKLDGMAWVLENKADGIKNKETFENAKKVYEKAVAELKVGE